ncbi:MAG TPA: TlpA disulfide reductase family protein [Nannocystaceae bacterium]|nr:TlpA disulfide reductase family protein [Nannocystaceae bacterium]
MQEKPQLDPFGALAYILYAGIGGLLVYGFAAALSPAVERQNTSACKPMRPEIRDGAAPSFTVQDLEGNEVSLEDFKGKFLVVNFWATWCEPCLGEWPQVHQLAERLGDRDDVAVVAISLDPDPGAIAPFLERMALGATRVQVLWDPEQTLEKEFGTEKLPDTYFVDENGQLVHYYENTRKWGAPGAVQCVESMIGRS